MRSRSLLVGAALLAGATATPSTLTPAAVADAQFPPNNVRDLIAICAPAPDDPRMTASVNFCHGFVEGAVIVEEANEAQKGARKLFGTASQRHREHRRRENELLHRALRVPEASAGQGNLSAKYTNMPSTDGISSRAGC